MSPSALLLILAVSALSISSLTSAGTPQVLPIVKIVDSTFRLNSSNLKDILDKVPPKVEVGVIAIAGEYRQGKSFVLNFFLQYLQYRSQNTNVPKIFQEDELQELISQKSHPWLRDVPKNFGFQFSAGTSRNTTGINIWSEPYLIKSKSGKQLALLLMDSQGLYDKDTSTDDNVRLFTMVSMMSSLLMLNVKSNINSNQLKELQYFLNYASNGTMTGTHKPFQTLTFLIRDFTLGENLGWKGGQDVLNDFMSPGSDQSNPEIQAITQSLHKGFEKINAFAMPFPGNQVTRSDYDGSLIKIDMMFLQQLQSFIIETVETTAPKNDRLDNLQGSAFWTYTQGLVDAFNKKLSPQELNRLQESKMLMKILDDINNLVNKYANYMTNYVTSMPDCNFEGKSNDEINTEIRNEHNRHEALIMKDFLTLPISKANVRLSSDNKPVTASQELRDKINQKYSELSQRLANDAIQKRDHCPYRGYVGEEDCCPLVWQILFNNQLIPSDSIKAGLTKNGYTTYFTWLDGYKWVPSSSHKIGVVSDENVNIAYYERANKAYTYDGTCINSMKGESSQGCPRDPIVILTNPFECSVDWWKREHKRQMPVTSLQFQFPLIGGHYFAKRNYGKYTGAGVVDLVAGNNKGDYHEVYNKGVWNYASAGTEILRVDCKTSINKVIQAELVQIHFDIDKLVDRNKTVSLASTIIDNSNGSTTQKSRVTLDATKMEQLTISYEYTLGGEIGVGFSQNIGATFKGLTVGMSRSIDAKISFMAKTGKMEIHQTESKFTFDQEITVQPQTVMKVDIISIPITGTVPFNATYAVTSKAFKKPSAILATLQRQGFKILQYQTDGDKVIINYSGTMSIDTGYNTHVVFRETKV